MVKKGWQHMSFQEARKINHLLFLDALKLYGQNEKGLDLLVQKKF